MSTRTKLITSKERIVNLRIYELGARLHQDMAAGKTIVKCWQPDCPLYKIHNIWFPFHEAGPYPNVSHGICPKHAAELQAEADRLLADLN